MKKKENTSHFGAQNVRLRGFSNSKERISNFSLDFPAFKPSDRVWPRSKVVLRSEGYGWALALWSFDNSKR